jgi:hypothetical protein
MDFSKNQLMRILLVFFVLISSYTLNALPNSAASNNINGFIRDKDNGETLVAATVFLDGTSYGTFTSKKGYYNLTNIPAGSYILKVSNVGYQTFEKAIEVKANQNLRVDVDMVPTDIMKNNITVTAEREVERREITVSKVNIPVEQIKEIRIGGESDVFRSIQMLPGVLTSSQVSSGLFIRGGSPDQNLVLLDGSTVYNPSHLFGFISSFNSDAIKDVELIKGGYPAEFGSRMSSVINITQKDGNRNEFEGLASIGAISSKLSLQGPVGKGSWFLGARRSYFDLILNLIPEDDEVPYPDFGFYDINAKVTQNITENDQISASGFLSRDDFFIENSGVDVTFFLGNRTGALDWTHVFQSDLFFDLNLTGSYYFNGFKQNITGFKVKAENSIRDYSLKGKLEWFTSEDLTLKTGFEVNNYLFKYEQNFTGDDSTSNAGTSGGGRLMLEEDDWTYAAYVSGNYIYENLWSVQPGIRINYWDYSDILTFDPRLALKYQIQEKIALKASWGIYHQYLRLAGDENVALFDTWLPTDNTVEPSKAVHYIFSVESELFEGYDFNFDVYYKELENINEVKRTTLEGSKVSDVFYNGNGEAYGFEVFLQKKFGRFAGWVGYAWGKVNARFDSINYGEVFNPKYDRRHDFKIVLKYELTDKWSIGSSFMLQSGQPYTGASSKFRVNMSQTTYGKDIAVQLNRYGLRLPPSHQLNMNATYNTSFFKLPAKFIIDIYNVYSRRDILFRYYDLDGEVAIVNDVLLLPIIPTVSYEVRF